MAYDMFNEGTANAMLEGLKLQLREALRGQFQKVAEEIIEEAIKETVDGLEATLQTYLDPMNQRQVVEVILKDKRT